MKAFILEQPGDIENLRLTDLPMPAISAEDVLVKVKAISINPVDMKTRRGKSLYGELQKDPPVILGWDISGEVEEVGSDVRNFQKGDEVFGMVNFPGHGKAYAEYVAAPAAHLVRKPAGISHQEAAATTLAALTAWQVLVPQARLQKGQRVLIHAAAGGVGHFAVQIAKHLGAYVIGTASASNASFLKALGVDEPVDYKSVDFESAVQKVDLVLDAIGGDNITRSMEVLKQGGRLITIAGHIDEEKEKQAQAKNIRAERYVVHSSGEDMQQLVNLLQAGKLKPHISQEYPFEALPEAHYQIETGKTRGKLIVNI